MPELKDWAKVFYDEELVEILAQKTGRVHMSKTYSSAVLCSLPDGTKAIAINTSNTEIPMIDMPHGVTPISVLGSMKTNQFRVSDSIGFIYMVVNRLESDIFSKQQIVNIVLNYFHNNMIPVDCLFSIFSKNFDGYFIDIDTLSYATVLNGKKYIGNDILCEAIYDLITMQTDDIKSHWISEE